MVFTVILLFIGITLAQGITAHNNSSFVNTIYVDDDNTEGPWDGTQEHPYQFIQDAIDNASDGDTVFVYGGIYYEQVVIDKSITLMGEEKNTTVIDGEKVEDVIHIIGNGTTICSFTIQNARGGLFSDDAGVDIRGNNNLITDNIIFDNHNYGIYVRALDSNNTITNNMFDDNTLGLKLRFTSDTIVSNNTFIDNYNGIEMEFVDHVNITGNTFVNSTNVIRAEKMYSSVITRNNITSNGGNVGVILTGGSCANKISNNIIKNSGKKHWAGLCLDSLSNDNTISGNVVDSFKYGIGLAASDGNIINGNIVRNNGEYGISLAYTQNCDIYENTIENNGEYGLFLQYDIMNNKIYHNNFLNNTKHAKASGTNKWDDSWKGNYWDDYKEKYPDANKKLRGVWNTPYELNDNNVDRYPLIQQYSSNVKQNHLDRICSFLFGKLQELFPFLHNRTLSAII